MGWLSWLNSYSFGFFQDVWGTPIEMDKPLPEIICFNPDDNSPLQRIAKGASELNGDAKEGSLQRSNSIVRFVIISDTHTKHGQLEIPDGDVLLHCGDWTKWKSSEEDVSNFNDWLGQLPHKHKIVIAGNHEVCERNINIREVLNNATYLESETVVVEGVKIHGAPYHRQRGFLYRANAFGMQDDEIKAKWEAIPNDVDILMTHIPPYGILDVEEGGHVGCPYLYDAIQRTKPGLHCFGHVHGQRGCATIAAGGQNGTVYCNAATSRKGGMNGPVVVDFESRSLNS